MFNHETLNSSLPALPVPVRPVEAMPIATAPIRCGERWPAKDPAAEYHQDEPAVLLWTPCGSERRWTFGAWDGHFWRDDSCEARLEPTWWMPAPASPPGGGSGQTPAERMQIILPPRG